MEIIYEAERPSGNVAVKVPHLFGLNPPEYVGQRLRIEGEVLKRLNHLLIVKYIDERDEGQIPVLVEELVRGSNLREFEGKLYVDVAIKLGIKLADMLKHLHDNRIIQETSA